MAQGQHPFLGKRKKQEDVKENVSLESSTSFAQNSLMEQASQAEVKQGLVVPLVSFCSRLGPHMTC